MKVNHKKKQGKKKIIHQFYSHEKNEDNKFR
jgi:hypothetical protein